MRSFISHLLKLTLYLLYFYATLSLKAQNDSAHLLCITFTHHHYSLSTLCGSIQLEHIHHV
jgi:uncharacterized membrane protein YciS (DUF1049 family)